MTGPPNYDAILIVSFGGPDGPDDVLPFLENVLKGRRVPRERMLEVAGHYHHFGGVSPINSQNRALIAALVEELNSHGPQLPVYWGNRNWHPLLPDAIRQMAEDGIQHALAFVTSPYSSHSSCRQYLENINGARLQVGDAAPKIDKLRAFYNHPGFIDAIVDRVREALNHLPSSETNEAQFFFTAHSIPIAMAKNCQYVAQLEEACRLAAEGAGIKNWQLAYQSRSGPPTQPWLEPDICDVIRHTGQAEARDIDVVPIGFIADHMEVIYDLDVEVQEVCDERGLNMVRASTVGTHPRFVRMIRELILERVDSTSPRLAVGSNEPSHDVCPTDCCAYQPSRHSK